MVGADPDGGLRHVVAHDFSEDTLAGLDNRKVRQFKAWRATGYHPDLMPKEIPPGHLYAARALYTHLNRRAVEAHVKDPKGFDPLGVNQNG